MGIEGLTKVSLSVGRIGCCSLGCFLVGRDGLGNGNGTYVVSQTLLTGLLNGVLVFLTVGVGMLEVVIGFF